MVTDNTSYKLPLFFFELAEVQYYIRSYRVCRKKEDKVTLCKTSTWHASILNQVDVWQSTLLACCAEVSSGCRPTCEPPWWAACRLHKYFDTKWPEILMPLVFLFKTSLILQWNEWAHDWILRFYNISLRCQWCSAEICKLIHKEWDEDLLPSPRWFVLDRCKTGFLNGHTQLHSDNFINQTHV